MTFLTLWKKLGKQSIADNKQDITAVLGVDDIKKLCAGKPDWESISIPLTLKFSAAKGVPKVQYFIADLKKLKGAKKHDKKAK